MREVRKRTISLAPGNSFGNVMCDFIEADWSGRNRSGLFFSAFYEGL